MQEQRLLHVVPRMRKKKVNSECTITQNSLSFGLQIRRRINIDSKKFLEMIAERMRHPCYAKQREVTSQLANIGKLNEEIELMKKRLIISIPQHKSE